MTPALKEESKTMTLTPILRQVELSIDSKVSDGRDW